MADESYVLIRHHAGWSIGVEAFDTLEEAADRVGEKDRRHEIEIQRPGQLRHERLSPKAAKERVRKEKEEKAKQGAEA